MRRAGVALGFALWLTAPGIGAAGDLVTELDLGFDGCEPPDLPFEVVFPQGWVVDASPVGSGAWEVSLSIAAGHQPVDPEETELRARIDGFVVTPWAGRKDGDRGVYHFPCKRIVALEVGSEPPSGLEFYFQVWEAGGLDGPPREPARTTTVLDNLVGDASVRVVIDRGDCVVADHTFYLDEMEIGKRTKLPLLETAADCEMEALDAGPRSIGQGRNPIARALAGSAFRYNKLVVRLVENETALEDP